jgi:hypothetical protein
VAFAVVALATVPVSSARADQPAECHAVAIDFTPASDPCAPSTAAATPARSPSPRCSPLARTGNDVDACFVATAVVAKDVEVLRRFRDLVLRRSVLGELFVESYYTFGPPVAGVVGESELLRASARDALAPVVSRVR